MPLFILSMTYLCNFPLQTDKHEHWAHIYFLYMII